MSKPTRVREFKKGDRVYIRQEGDICTPGDVVRVSTVEIKVIAEDGTTVDFEPSAYGKPHAFMLGRKYWLDSEEDWQAACDQMNFLRSVDLLATDLRRLPRDRALGILHAAKIGVDAYDKERLHTSPITIVTT